MKYMLPYFGVLFILFFFFAVGAIDADNYIIGLAFAFAGFVTGGLTVYAQEYVEKKDEGLYYKEK